MLRLKLSAAYFAAVFAAGFLLGTLRVVWLVPRLGERYAELIETPFMLIVAWLTAGVLVRRWQPQLRLADTVFAGAMSLGMLLALEFTVVLYLRELSIHEYVETRDSISGTVYGLSLLAFAAMPAVHYRRLNPSR